jgi:DNA sulfur modification protein DndD
MLALRRIEIKGFGPYAEPAVLEFPEEPGVTVVYGDNMRGKTTLLNAIFYAFFGEVRARGSRRAAIIAASNRDLAADGQWGFTVTLDVRYDGADYQIVRTATPKVATPTSDDDFTLDVYVRRGGTTLGPAERAHLLDQMLPRDVARFFLFDGELLSEYEELLVNESETGRRISAAIEQILGVPVLKSARTILAGLAAQANKESAKEASKHQETESLGNALDTANKMLDHHVEEHRREIEVLHGLFEERAEVEDFLKRREKYAAAVERLRAARATEKQAGQDEATALGQLRDTMADAWRTVLDDTVREARAAAQQAATDAFASLTLVLRHQAIADHRCSICEQEVPEDVRERLAGTVPAGVGTTADFTGLGAMARVAELAEFTDKDVRPQVTLLWTAIERARMAKVAAQTEIADATAELADSDVEALEAKMASVTELAGKIKATEDAIRGHEEKIVEQQEAIDRLARKIAEAGSPALAAIQRRERFLKVSTEVFSAAVEGYKADLRGRVEGTASERFLAMTTEKEDYAALSINEQYGLAIVHRDGRTEDSRSAGAEQVVALALMGALQANAPLRGPIVMDTPFGRLDPGHTANVVDTLPSMADQVVLFVQEGEIDRSQVREILGTRLLREYQLDRQSSRRTRVVEAH